MLVRDLLELIGDCNNIIIHCDKLHETWQGEASNMPVRYGECEINKIFSTIVMDNMPLRYEECGINKIFSTIVKYNKSALVIRVNK